MKVVGIRNQLILLPKAKSTQPKLNKLRRNPIQNLPCSTMVKKPMVWPLPE